MPSPPPASLGDRAKEYADQARDLAGDLVGDFKRSDRYFKMRAGVIATWCILALLTLWNACPRSGPRNELGAEVRLLKEAMIGGAQLMVRNESAVVWTNVSIILDGEWRYHQRSLLGHDKLVVEMTKFARGEEPAPEQLKPRVVTIDCDQGKLTATLDQ